MGVALSLVVVGYNMGRELPRTIRSLSHSMQREMEGADYEVILVDNGSTRPWDESECRRWFPALNVQRMRDPGPSPVAAINRGLALAGGDLIGVWIDGARLASPGLLAGALRAARIHPRPVITALGFHLGPDLQRHSIKAGYDQAREDALLDAVRWEEDGYRLFQIASLAGASAGGWFQPIGESNALFLTRAQWEALGGYEARFQMPGGGLANLDTWRRACEAPGSQVVVLLGEGTFHQVHGGVATNADRPMFPVFHEEYQRIRGEPYLVPQVSPIYLGRIHPAVLPSLAWSAHQALAAAGDPAGQAP